MEVIAVTCESKKVSIWDGQRSIVRDGEVVNDEWLILVMDDEGVLSDDVSPTDRQHPVEPRDPVSSRCTGRIEPRRKASSDCEDSISATVILIVNVRLHSVCMYV